MAHAHGTDYTKLFEVSNPPKIYGEPDYESLKKLKDILKANASRISSELGGGGHGHLGLILTANEYATVSNTPYVRPIHPGPLIIPNGATQHIVNTLRDQNKEAVALYHETTDLDNALKKQITDAIEPAYLDELRDSTTNAITSTIPDILSFLFSNYGDITPETILEKAQRIRDMEFSVADPLMKLYTPIEELQQLAEEVLPFTTAQLLEIGLAVLKRTELYSNALGDWYKRPVAEHTWVNFKAHFQTARRLLKKLRGPTLGQTSLTNALTEQVRTVREELNSLHETQSSMLQAVSDNQSVLSQMANAMVSDNSHVSAISMDENSNPNPQINLANQTNADLLNIIKALQNEVAQIKLHQNNNNAFQNQNRFQGNQNQSQANRYQGSRSRRSQRRGNNRRFPQNFQNPQPMQNMQPTMQTMHLPPGFPVNTQIQGQTPQTAQSGFQCIPTNANQQQMRFGGQNSIFRQAARPGNWWKYCWTHGICGHASHECVAPAPGHQAMATLENRMGGNNYTYKRR